MREAYKDVMDRIVVTQEMQARILRTIRTTEFQPRRRSAPIPARRVARKGVRRGFLHQLRAVCSA